MRPPRYGLLAAALLMGGMASGVQAQALSCTIPATITLPRPSAPEPARLIPLGAYTLALSWSPQYCRSQKDRTDFQCGGRSRFGFVLHGLWPDGEGRQYPQYCRPAGALPQRVVRDMLCTTPSVDLIQHEWAKHGTCGWRDPATYFGKGKTLYQGLRFPDMAALSRQQGLTVRAFRALFARANGVPTDAVRVRVGNGGWLSELWLCLDKRFAYARCRSGQKGGAPAEQRLRIWRS